MKTFLGWVLMILYMVIGSFAMSFVFASIHWLWGLIISRENNQFLHPFLWGALGIFIVWFLFSAIKTIKRMRNRI